ncbi:MAG: tetratricopeptide repeat protein [Bacteroidia bacterium]|nr:tetratricopeptide repeat protein [Bacteroidia bacterium]
MRKQLALLFILSFTLFKAQNFDSLLFVSIKINADTEKVNLFYSEGFEKRNKIPQYSYNCARQAEHFALQSKSQKHIAKAYNLLGILFYKKGDLKTALNFHQKALAIREELKDEYGIALSETNLGNIYSDLKNYEAAELSYLNALQINSKIANEKQCGNCYINLGVLKIAQNKIEEAEKYFYNAYKIAKNIVDYEIEAMALNNLSYINITKGNYEVAISNCYDALKAKDIMENEFEKTDSYLNLAKAFYYLKDFANSKYYLAKADSFCTAYDYTEARYQLYKLQSEIFEGEKNYEMALYAFKRFTQLKDSIETVNKSIENDYTFSDKEIISSPKESFQFPYLMLSLLIGGSIFIMFYIFKFKK